MFWLTLYTRAIKNFISYNKTWLLRNSFGLGRLIFWLWLWPGPTAPKPNRAESPKFTGTKTKVELQPRDCLGLTSRRYAWSAYSNIRFLQFIAASEMLYFRGFDRTHNNCVELLFVTNPEPSRNNLFWSELTRSHLTTRLEQEHFRYQGSFT